MQYSTNNKEYTSVTFERKQPKNTPPQSVVHQTEDSWMLLSASAWLGLGRAGFLIDDAVNTIL